MSTHMMTHPLLTFESYCEQIIDFDLLGLPPNPDYPQDISAKIKLMTIQKKNCAPNSRKNADLTDYVCLVQYQPYTYLLLKNSGVVAQEEYHDYLRQPPKNVYG